MVDAILPLPDWGDLDLASRPPCDRKPFFDNNLRRSLPRKAGRPALLSDRIRAWMIAPAMMHRAEPLSILGPVAAGGLEMMVELYGPERRPQGQALRRDPADALDPPLLVPPILSPGLEWRMPVSAARPDETIGVMGWLVSPAGDRHCRPADTTCYVTVCNSLCEIGLWNGFGRVL